MYGIERRRSEEDGEAAHERQAPRQCSENEGALGQSNREFLMAPFYAPQQRAQHPASTTVSYPPNTAYSNYFMPPYQTAQFLPLQHAGSPNMLNTFTSQQSPFPALRLIAPKPPQAENLSRGARSSGNRPPDFIETVKQIRKELYTRGGTTEDQNPPILQDNDYSQWRKEVMKRWEPHSMTHYIMVAKLSKKCFDLVLEIPQRINRKVTQGDFLHLYNKSDEEQERILKNILEKPTLLQDVKRRKRGKEAVRRATETTNKELEDEIARLKSQNTDLRIKLDQAIEDRDREKRRADTLQKRMKILERDNEDKFRQYRTDVDNLVAEKNDLGQSFLHHSLPSDMDMSDTSSHKTASSSSSESGESYVGTGSIANDDRRESEVSDNSEDDVPLSMISKGKSHVERARAADTSESNSESSKSETEGESIRLVTVSERIRMDAKGLKNKCKKKTGPRRSDEQRTSTPAKPQSPSAKKVSQRKTIQPFQDQWDYDLKKLVVGEWVAVAYKEGFFIGKVEKILSSRVRVNFLTKKQGVFSWPRPTDKADIQVFFIFSRNVKVTKAGEGDKEYHIEREELINDQFKAFSLKYF